MLRFIISLGKIMSKSLKKQILFVTWKKVYDQVYYFKVQDEVWGKVRLRIRNQLCANVLDTVLNKVKDHE